MKLRRILAGVLSAAMVLTCAPVSALAAGGGAVEVLESAVNETAEAESASVGKISGDTITYTGINLENENSYKITNSNDLDFFNKMQGFTLTIIGKRDENSENKPYALFTLKGKSKNAAGEEVDSYATMWYNPESNGYSCIAYNISRSSTGQNIQWSASAAEVATGKYFKYNITFTGTDASAKCISCTNNTGREMAMKSNGNYDATGWQKNLYCKIACKGNDR